MEKALQAVCRVVDNPAVQKQRQDLVNGVLKFFAGGLWRGLSSAVISLAAPSLVSLAIVPLEDVIDELLNS